MRWHTQAGQASPPVPDPSFADILPLAPNSLELGAGGGLVGLAVAGGCEIDNPLMITDQLEMFSLMEHNIELNGQHGRVQAAILNW